MYTMMQVCRELDMTYQTLKYYCNEGLVPNVKRDSNNRRVFDEKDVKWIKDLTCLKKCFLDFIELLLHKLLFISRNVSIISSHVYLYSNFFSKYRNMIEAKKQVLKWALIRASV